MELTKKSEQFTWQDLKLESALCHLLKTGEFADINLRVGPDEAHQQVFKCHKFVLLCASPYFEAMFYGTGEFVEKTQTEIKMTDIEPDDFKCFIDYAYSRKDIVNFEHLSIQRLLNFIYIGQKFLQPKFENFGYIGIETTLLKLRPVDLLDLFNTIHKVEYSRLIPKVTQELQLKIKTTTSFYQTLLEFDLSVFKTFVECIAQQVPENIRFKWIEEYIIQKGLLKKPEIKAKQKITKDENATKQHVSETQDWKNFLKAIRYDDISSEEFCSGPLKSDLIEINEKIQILAKKAMTKMTINCPYCYRKIN